MYHVPSFFGGYRHGHYSALSCLAFLIMQAIPPTALSVTTRKFPPTIILPPHSQCTFPDTIVIVEASECKKALFVRMDSLFTNMFYQLQDLIFMLAIHVHHMLSRANQLPNTFDGYKRWLLVHREFSYEHLRFNAVLAVHLQISAFSSCQLSLCSFYKRTHIASGTRKQRLSTVYIYF